MSVVKIAPESGGDAAITGVLGIETNSAAKTSEKAITADHFLFERSMLMYPSMRN
jgi:hypothetical protein